MQDAIHRYRAGADQLAAAIVDLQPADLAAFPIPGTWSIQQIVWHMLDSDLIGAERMKRIAVEQRPPLLIGYDESAFARYLPYDTLDPLRACEVFRLNRLITADLLARLPTDAAQHYGIHNEKGKVTLAEQVATYADHLDGHLAHLYKKRALLGKALP